MWLLIDVQNAKQLYNSINSIIKRQTNSELIILKKNVAIRNWKKRISCQTYEFSIAKIAIIWSHFRNISWFLIEFNAIKR